MLEEAVEVGTLDSAWITRQYERAVLEISSGRVSSRGPAVLVRPDTPRRLRELGLPNLPWFHGRTHIVTETGHVPERRRDDHSNVHRVATGTLMRLPSLLEDPVLVGCSESWRGETAMQPVMILDETDEAGDPLFCAVTLLGRERLEGGPDGSIHILTVHGRQQAPRTLAAMERHGKIGYVDRARLAALMRRCRSWVPARMARLDGRVARMPWEVAAGLG